MSDILTPEKLENASKDCDSWDLFFHGSELEDVVTRLGKVFPTLSKILRLFFDAGLFRPFQTEAQLLAYVPVTAPSAAYAFDTKKLYLWNGTNWIDEGLSPLDISRNYTDGLVIPTFDTSDSPFESLQPYVDSTLKVAGDIHAAGGGSTAVANYTYVLNKEVSGAKIRAICIQSPLIGSK
ncbi:hypothetical protein OHV98_17955, partial [Acinetobacter baumannii]|nr:hypothetical protein [Acinetobacter baumannii]